MNENEQMEQNVAEKAEPKAEPKATKSSKSNIDILVED